MKLGLGTVQFGLDYGISNKNGKPNSTDVSKIIELAHQNKIAILDTASVYGTSEEVLGRTLKENQDFNVVTKLPSLKKLAELSLDVHKMESIFQDSLTKLKTSSVYGLLIHDPNDLLSEDGTFLFELLMKLKANKLVQKIGVSGDTPKKLHDILNKFPLEIIQVPCNVFDQRHIPHFSSYQKKGIEIHVRSIFLQGLLLMDRDSIPSHLKTITPHLDLFHKICAENSLSPLEGCLSFISKLKDINTGIVGVNSEKNFAEILSAFNKVQNLNEINFHHCSVTDINIIDPSKWVKS